MASGRLVQQTADEWIPVVMDYIAVIDRGAADLTAMFGWTWAQGEEEGLGADVLRRPGLRRALALRADRLGCSSRARGRARGAAGRGPGGARRDFLDALGLEPDVFLSIREGAHWFERWDESKPFRVRGEV